MRHYTCGVLDWGLINGLEGCDWEGDDEMDMNEYTSAAVLVAPSSGAANP